MYVVKRCPVCNAEKDMRVVEDRWNIVDAQGGVGAVFVKYYYCETCNHLVYVEDVKTNGSSLVHDENVRQA